MTVAGICNCKRIQLSPSQSSRCTSVRAQIRPSGHSCISSTTIRLVCWLGRWCTTNQWNSLWPWFDLSRPSGLRCFYCLTEIMEDMEGWGKKRKWARPLLKRNDLVSRCTCQNQGINLPSCILRAGKPSSQSWHVAWCQEDLVTILNVLKCNIEPKP